MDRKEVTAVFDQLAHSYDEQWSRMSAINDALHLLTDAILAPLPSTASILCVGAGTGVEVLHLAHQFRNWTFTVVEPSAPMLSAFEQKAQKAEILSRCTLHTGYLDSLPESDDFDAATVFLVSQFIQDRTARTKFFTNISNRLLPGGLMVSSDLAGDMSESECQSLLEVWYALMSGAGVSDEGLKKIRESYNRDISVKPPHHVQSLIADGGFDSPVKFFQAGMIHAWYATRNPSEAPA